MVLLEWFVNTTFRLKSAFSRPDMFASVVLLRIRYGVDNVGSLEV